MKREGEKRREEKRREETRREEKQKRDGGRGPPRKERNGKRDNRE